MTMTDADRDVTGLDGFFAAARNETAALPEALEARMLADAAQVHRARAAPARRRQATAGPIRQLLAALGGWPAVGGLAAACAAGVWLGFAPPASLSDPVAAVMQSQVQSDLLDTFGADDFASALSEEG